MERMECDRCGGTVWRITSSGFLDDIRAAFGNVLYKCVRCGKRRRQRMWPRSHFIVAHCPRCYAQDMQVWNRAFVAATFWRSLCFALGGSAYRCYECHHVFVSLRPRRLFLHHKASGVFAATEPPSPRKSGSAENDSSSAESPSRREYTA
jgi:hypothetical protein